MKQAHFTLQRKGGVGKSLVSSIVAQYLQSLKVPLVAIDADPGNSTLAGYKALNAQRLEVMRNGSMDTGIFDSMIEQIIHEDSNFVIDNGASSFVPLSSYVVENDVFKMIAKHGKQVYVHTVIKAGQELRSTLTGFNVLAEQMPEEARIIVWLNEYTGEVVADGKTFEDMKIYKKHKDRVFGIVRIKERTSDTFGRDIRKMLEANLTFEEINMHPDFHLMSKSRLFQVKKAIFDQLEIMV
ncbi:MAG TPA: conjugal transfer protein TraL [Nitrosospira sp.]|nr:conjugal transfer protein TraL [Nitrosospira sp.]